MFQIVKRNPLAAVMAVVMHVAIIAFMLVGVDWLEKPRQPKTNVQVVQAKVTVMDITHTPPQKRDVGMDVHAGQGDRPFIRFPQTGHHLEGGGFAAARGPQKTA